MIFREHNSSDEGLPLLKRFRGVNPQMAESQKSQPVQRVLDYSSNRSPDPFHQLPGPSHQPPGPSRLPPDPFHQPPGPSHLPPDPFHQPPGPIR